MLPILGILLEYNYKVFQRCWGDAHDPNADDFINELCEDLDVDINDFISKSSTSDVRQRLKGIYNRGRKLGVFDTPTLVINQERFYGIDKLPYVDEYLKSLNISN